MSIISRFKKGFQLTEDEQHVLHDGDEHDFELENKIERGYNPGSEKLASAKDVRNIFKRFFHGTTNAAGLTTRVYKID